MHNAPQAGGSCAATAVSSGASEPSGWAVSVVEWIEAHLLAVQTVHASTQCDPWCTGHYQGPDWIGGCGHFGICGDYCASDPTRFDYEDGCIDCVIDDPNNYCDGCQEDKECNNATSPPPPDSGQDQTPPAEDP